MTAAAEHAENRHRERYDAQCDDQHACAEARWNLLLILHLVEMHKSVYRRRDVFKLLTVSKPARIGVHSGDKNLVQNHLVQLAINAFLARVEWPRCALLCSYSMYEHCYTA